MLPIDHIPRFFPFTILIPFLYICQPCCCRGTAPPLFNRSSVAVFLSCLTPPLFFSELSIFLSFLLFFVNRIIVRKVATVLDNDPSPWSSIVSHDALESNFTARLAIFVRLFILRNGPLTYLRAQSESAVVYIHLDLCVCVCVFVTHASFSFFLFFFFCLISYLLVHLPLFFNISSNRWATSGVPTAVMQPETSSVDLQSDVRRACELISQLSMSCDPETADRLSQLRVLLESPLFDSVRSVYECLQQNVRIAGSPDVSAAATAKATLAVFAAAQANLPAGRSVPVELSPNGEQGTNKPVSFI